VCHLSAQTASQASFSLRTYILHDLASLQFKMVKTVAVVATLLGLAALVAAQNTNCPAKFRFQWFYQLADPTPANLKAVDSLTMKWMREDCDKVLFFGHGPSIATKPAAYG
jgi:hypothetical protein